MFTIQITAFFILLLGIAWRFRIHLVEAAAVGSALLILGLYVLAFFRALSFSDYIAVTGIVLCGIYLAKLSQEKRKELLQFARREMVSPATLTALIMTVVMTVCVSSKVVSWWDDYNFWATDVKSLFYLDGYAQKYTNVAAEFGDYPPGTQLMKWWFLHFSPGKFREGLMFAGYYFLNLSFLFPMLRILNRDCRRRENLQKGADEISGYTAQRTKYSVWKKISQMAIAAALLWLFPSVAEAFWCDGCCADLTMALVYGAFLVSVVDKEHGRFFYYGRQTLFLMVLVLCKNTGFLWAAFGLLFDYGYHFLFLRFDTTKRRNAWPLLIVTLFPVLTEGSWLGFCLLSRRVAKLTGTAIQMVTGGMNIPAYQSEMVKAFAKAFLTWPLHRGKTPGIDLSPLGLFLLLLVFVWVLWKARMLERRKALYLGSFLAITGVVFYSINLVSHLTIFAVETQYLEPFGMVSSIERYGAPFAIGGLYLLAFFATRGAKAQAGAVFCMVFVLVTTDYGAAYRALYGYRSEVEEILAQREEIIDEAAEEFLAAVNGRKDFSGRVLYLRDISDVSWVRNTYVGFEASPVSVMYGNIDVATADSQVIINAIWEAHAGFVYVDELFGEQEGAGEELFHPFMNGEEFCYGCLYQVQETGDGVRLAKVNY